MSCFKFFENLLSVKYNFTHTFISSTANVSSETVTQEIENNLTNNEMLYGLIGWGVLILVAIIVIVVVLKRSPSNTHSYSNSRKYARQQTISSKKAGKHISKYKNNIKRY